MAGATRRRRQKAEEKLPTAHQELTILQSLLQEMKALWGLCDLIERRFRVAGLTVDEPTSRTDAFESCGRLKMAIQSLLPEAEQFYIDHLEAIASWTKQGMKLAQITSPEIRYYTWLKSVAKLQYTTRAWRERAWLEIDCLPWTDDERETIATQLLWESTPPSWLRNLCTLHRLPLVSEPVALGSPTEGLFPPGHRAKLRTIRELADWADARIKEPRKVNLATARPAKEKRPVTTKRTTAAAAS